MAQTRARLACVLAALLAGTPGGAAPPDTAPRVPPEALEAARRLRNPLPATPENLARGAALYAGKGFCATCHGRTGRGLGPDVDTTRLRGALPRDLTDPAWQQARSDGELLWTLKNGSAGTAMAAFVPQIFDEEEAWLVLLHVRALGRR